MTPRNDWNERLIRYVSGELNEAEAAFVESELQRSAELQKKLDQIKEIDRFLQRQSKPSHPSKKFTDQVMHGIAVPARNNSLSPKMGLWMLLGVLVITTLAVLSLRSGLFDSMEFPISLNMQSLHFDKLSIPSFNLPFSGKWLVSIFLVLNIAVGFILLDRTILKPYFQRRAEANH
ncbi:MAG: hypothetical protein HOP30_09295 [Cyclobacteriaceae bacterium]|nr:hypothetical protein [Cyclobacteriaceae bacterium]